MAADPAQAGRSSFVTNMNGLMPEIIGDEFDLDNPAIQETSREGTIFQVRRWFRCARNILHVMKYLPHIEHLLDDDRLAGEWENTPS